MGVFMLGAAGTAPATVYDATTEFSIYNGNANGVWSYGWMPTDFSEFHLYESAQMNGLSPQWYREGSIDYTPMIWRIDDSVARNGVQVGQLALHPSEDWEASVLRWTAPDDGWCSIEGQFFAGDGGMMEVGIRQGNDWLWQATDDGSFSLEKTIAAGTPVDFLVYGGYYSGNTPIELDIDFSRQNAVPEPATMMLFGVGLAGFAVRRRKK